MKGKISILRLLRLSMGLSMVELSNQIGISPAKLSLIERGLQRPLDVELYKLSRVFGCDVSKEKEEENVKPSS
jgi:transcriptional regulator with XRE-family HTH domain